MDYMLDDIEGDEHNARLAAHVDTVERTLRTPHYQEVVKDILDGFVAVNEVMSDSGFCHITDIKELCEWSGVKRRKGT